ncbi:four-carbon acid sugar kinase family protein [Streptomyces corynorhini]|uniref:3-oxo-tetronate kinase n=1 Tax=Streptomyces corynorhini TaxID=2282652 RepID=A0A370B6J8_9ACTN|nr:four-carbon acid sugar kinase family protein [Streptomyces corynorhini]
MADDFTGATDLATNWVARGVRTSVTLGVPTERELAGLADMDAVVVALKSRTAPVAEAVGESVAALAALRRLGCERIYDKYCSTFDSTPRGNIGPVADALTAELGTGTAVVVPSFPATGRTVYRGHLFVGDQLLGESPMRHHPLTPMTDSHLVRLLSPQTRHPVRAVGLDVVRGDPRALRAALDTSAGEGPGYVVVDAIDNDDLTRIAAATAHHPLVTGGSGLALGLPSRGAPATGAMPVVPGHRAVLAGSASAATRAQIEAALPALPARRLDLAALRADPAAEIAGLTDWARTHWADEPGRPVLVYAVGSLTDIERHPPEGLRPAAELVEDALADCAVAFAGAGARQFVVAGGETSGSVVRALGVRRLELGPALAPGVSWTHGSAPDGASYNLALKSGNFGGPSLFTGAWGELR